MKQKSDQPETDGTNASTGPRTDSGKATSSRNAETHGLISARFILPEEDRHAFTQLLENLLEEHSPASETERLLVLQIAQSFWQEQRSCPPAARLLTSEPDRRMRKRYAVTGDSILVMAILLFASHSFSSYSAETRHFHDDLAAFLIKMEDRPRIHTPALAKALLHCFTF